MTLYVFMVIKLAVVVVIFDKANCEEGGGIEICGSRPGSTSRSVFAEQICGQI